MLALIAAILGYISILLYLRLGSQGVAVRRIVRVILELWLTFAAIIGIFALISQRVGPVAGSSMAAQLFAELARVHSLPANERTVIYLGLLLTVALFVHFLWSWQSMQRKTDRFGSPHEGGTA